MKISPTNREVCKVSCGVYDSKSNKTVSPTRFYVYRPTFLIKILGITGAFTFSSHEDALSARRACNKCPLEPACKPSGVGNTENRFEIHILQNEVEYNGTPVDANGNPTSI